MKVLASGGSSGGVEYIMRELEEEFDRNLIKVLDGNAALTKKLVQKMDYKENYKKNYFKF
nr:hypothetical protein [Pseudodesulfovibrio sp.]